MVKNGLNGVIIWKTPKNNNPVGTSSAVPQYLATNKYIAFDNKTISAWVEQINGEKKIGTLNLITIPTCKHAKL